MAVISSVPTQAKRLALTFDDGPHSRFTGQILDVLHAEGVSAAFFVRGGALNSETNDIVQRAAAEGHDVENHTHSHLNLESESDETIEQEITRTHFQLEQIVGRWPDLIRPPYGRAPERVDAIAQPMGYRGTVTWSVQANDWELPPAKTIVERVLGGITPGAIVLLHDGCDPGNEAASRQATVDAVSRLIPQIRERGYELVALSQLLDG